MSDSISAIPLVTLLGAMDTAELLSDSAVPQAARPAHQQPSPLGEEVELTLSATALLESAQAGSSLAQLVGNNGSQPGGQVLSLLGSYPMPSPASARPNSPADILTALKPQVVLNAPDGKDAQQPPATSPPPGLVLAQPAQLLPLLRRAAREPAPTLISPLVDDPEKLAAATAQNLYLSYAEPLEPSPHGALVRKLIFGGIALGVLLLALYLLR